MSRITLVLNWVEMCEYHNIILIWEKNLKKLWETNVLNDAIPSIVDQYWHCI